MRFVMNPSIMFVLYLHYIFISVLNTVAFKLFVVELKCVYIFNNVFKNFARFTCILLDDLFFFSPFIFWRGNIKCGCRCVFTPEIWEIMGFYDAQSLKSRLIQNWPHLLFNAGLVVCYCSQKIKNYIMIYINSL